MADESENDAIRIVMSPPILPQFKYCPECGEPVSQPLNGNPFVCSGCRYTYFFNPASAVAGIIQNEAEEILLIRRQRDPAKGKLSLPGGFVDPGESALDALHREIKEEVNLKVKSHQFLTSYPNQYEYRSITYPVVDLFFLVEVANWDSLTPESAEVSEISFQNLTPALMEHIAFPSIRQALAFYLALKNKKRDSPKTASH